jgi:hypothetical protein
VIYGALIVVGVLLGVFGVIRMTAEDAEVGRLEDRLAAVETDQTEVRGQLDDVEAEQAAVVEATTELDASLVGLVDSFEAFVQAQQDVVAAWNQVFAPLEQTVDQLVASVETLVKPEITKAKAALNDLLEALATTSTLYQDTLAVTGGEGG